MEPSTIEMEMLRDSFVEPIPRIPDDLGDLDVSLVADLDDGGDAEAFGSLFDLDRFGLRALDGTRQAVCITDARVDLPGPRIVYVNNSYTDIFCCEVVDVIGQTPRLGQGPLTNRHVLDRLRTHLEAGESVQAQAINYRIDRTAFRLRWSIDPIRSGGVVIGFIAFMRDVTADDRMRRRLAALDTLMDRGRAASELARADRDESVSMALAAALRPIVAEIGSASVRVGQSVESTQIDADVAYGVDAISADFSVGSAGSIEVKLHPDANDLFDRLAVTELAEHARWLLSLGEPS